MSDEWELSAEIAVWAGLPPLPAGRFLVVAGSYQEFRYWRIGRGVPLHSASYVSRGEHLRGVSGVAVVFYGTYRSRPDFREIHDGVSALRASGRVSVRYDYDIPEEISA